MAMFSPRGVVDGLLRFFRWLFPPAAQWKAALPAFGLAVLSAFLLRLTYQPLHLSPLAFVALVPLFWGLRICRNPVMAAWAGLFFGMVHGYQVLGWMTSVSRFNPLIYLAVLPVCFWWGLHRAVAMGLLSWVARKIDPWLALPLGALIFAGMDYFQSVGAFAFPAGHIGHSLGGWTAMANGASLGGSVLLTAVIVLVNLSIMETIAAFQKKFGRMEAGARLAISVVLAGLVWGYGSSQLRAIEDSLEADDALAIRVALVQTGIDQALKYESYTSPDDARRLELQNEMFRSLMGQLGTIGRGEVDVVVTPESSLTHDFVDVEREYQHRTIGYAPFDDLQQVAREIEAPIIVGGVDYLFRDAGGRSTEYLREGVELETGMLRPGYRIYGGLWIVRPGELEVPKRADYRKMQLMPFGETVPYFDVIPGFRENLVQVGNFDRGRPGSPIGVHVEREETLPGTEPPTALLGPSICFEDLFPWVHRHHVRQGANLFVNSTNDGWFDGSSAAAYHFSGARWRSFEFGVPMIRATNTGITGVIEATGRVGERLPPFDPGILVTELRLPADPPLTPVARFGQWFGFLAFWISVLALGATWWFDRAPKPSRR